MGSNRFCILKLICVTDKPFLEICSLGGILNHESFYNLEWVLFSTNNNPKVILSLYRAYVFRRIEVTTASVFHKEGRRLMSIMWSLCGTHLQNRPSGSPSWVVIGRLDEYWVKKLSQTSIYYTSLTFEKVNSSCVALLHLVFYGFIFNSDDLLEVNFRVRCIIIIHSFLLTMVTVKENDIFIPTICL